MRETNILDDTLVGLLVDADGKVSLARGAEPDFYGTTAASVEDLREGKLHLEFDESERLAALSRRFPRSSN